MLEDMEWGLAQAAAAAGIALCVGWILFRLFGSEGRRQWVRQFGFLATAARFAWRIPAAWGAACFGAAMTALFVLCLTRVDTDAYGPIRGFVFVWGAAMSLAALASVSGAVVCMACVRRLQDRDMSLTAVAFAAATMLSALPRFLSQLRRTEDPSPFLLPALLCDGADPGRLRALALGLEQLEPLLIADVKELRELVLLIVFSSGAGLFAWTIYLLIAGMPSGNDPYPWLLARVGPAVVVAIAAWSFLGTCSEVFAAAAYLRVTKGATDEQLAAFGFTRERI